ncbi:MAG TPA: T9SS type A sorting domain-containing protein [Ignavibacteria bacterium]|nr:T9SS type A sorting domain-containing protein [Ignavibacteria bacterium]
MKKLIYSLLFMSFMIALFVTPADAGDRKVIIERFTSSTCGPCASNNPNLEAFLSTADPSKVKSISYHMNWPAPGNDPMYLANTADNTARRTNYGVNAIPTWIFDGVTSITGGSSSTVNSIFNQRTNVLSPVTVILTETRTGSTVNSTVKIYCETMLPNPSATVHFVISEKLVSYPFPPGTNGEMHFHDVMRKMLPNGIGTGVTLLPGKVITLNYTYQIDPTWNASQIESIVMVQGAPLEIHNTGTLTLDFNLFSAPSYRVVNQGQTQNADYKVHIPSVADGFNSAVTFTSEVLSGTPGITVQYPNGNVISSFPDSLNVNVASNGSVPAGEYQILLTGTSANGKVHKTIINYLVGRSYIVTGTDRKGLSYKVDGTSYNTPRVFTWDLNSSHTLEAVSPQTIGNFRYIYNSWTNGGPQSQTINVNTTETSYAVINDVQFRLLGLTEPAGLPVTISGGIGNYIDSAAAVTLTLSALQLSHNGKTYYFNRWEGQGEGSYTGPNASAQFNMHSVIVQKAVFDTIDVGISNYSSLVPDKFSLYQNYPNPFNPSTIIKFDIAKSTYASIIVYDMLGKEVSKLVNQNLTPGSYQFTLNAGNFPSGIYYYKIQTDYFTDIKKMMLLK